MHTEMAKALVRSIRCGLSLTSAVLAGCLAGQPEASSTGPAAIPETGRLQVPGSYVTIRSCGSEWGDLVVLTLLPDGLFSLRQTYRDEECGRPVTLVYLGHWSMADDGRELRLDNGPVWLRHLAVLDRRRLRIPDRPPPEPPATPVVATASRMPLLPFQDPFHLRGLGTSPAGVQ